MNIEATLRALGRCVYYHAGLAKHLGGVNAALLFSQIHYWQDKTDNPMGVYKSTDDLYEETGMTYREQASARSALVKSGVLIETNKRLEHRIYFKIDYEALDGVLANCEMCISPNAESAIGEVRKPQVVNKEEMTYRNDLQNIKEKTPKLKGKLEKPEDVDQQIWEDWLQLRKTKKAPVTQTALDGIAREAAKAGYTLEKALEACCSNGWQGFKAEWVNRGNGGNSQGGVNPTGRPPMKTFDQQRREEGWARWEERNGRDHPDRLAAQAPQRDLIDITPRGDSLYLE